METASIAPELYWTGAVALLTALCWLPYILGFIAEVGLGEALTRRNLDEVGTRDWAVRAQAAHRNAVENLAVFAPLAIAVAVSGTGTALTATAAAVYFWLRLAHYVVYVAGIPVIRTLLFAGGVVCQLILAAALLGLA